jgi:hypothetical protein
MHIQSSSGRCAQGLTNRYCCAVLRSDSRFAACCHAIQSLASRFKDNKQIVRPELKTTLSTLEVLTMHVASRSIPLEPLLDPTQKSRPPEKGLRSHNIVYFVQAC